jgi:hypothetical protein
MISATLAGTGRLRTTVSGFVAGCAVRFDARLMPHKLSPSTSKPPLASRFRRPWLATRSPRRSYSTSVLARCLAASRFGRHLMSSTLRSGRRTGKGLRWVEEDRRHAGCYRTDVGGGDDRVEPIGFAART